MSSSVHEMYHACISFRTIPEVAASKKLMGMIPIVGGMANFINELGLLDKIAKETDRDWLIKLIEIKNEYKVISVARSTLELGIAYAFMSQDSTFTYAAIFSALSVCCVLNSARQYYKNAKVIEKIKHEGFKGPEIWYVS